MYRGEEQPGFRGERGADEPQHDGLEERPQPRVPPVELRQHGVPAHGQARHGGTRSTHTGPPPSASMGYRTVRHIRMHMNVHIHAYTQIQIHLYANASTGIDRWIGRQTDRSMELVHAEHRDTAIDLHVYTHKHSRVWGKVGKTARGRSPADTVKHSPADSRAMSPPTVRRA
jgi:hypothetical protein